MPVSPDLATTQRWMQAVIMAPGDEVEALHAEAAAREIPPEQAEAMVLPSRTLSRLERLGVYRGMYEARLRDALEVDYPLLSGYLDEEVWEELTELYLEAHPSRSYTLNRLGDHLPEFLGEIEGLSRAAFLRDLARYELSLTRVFDAEETKALTADDLSAVAPDAWERIRLRPIAAFRLESYRYPVSAWAQEAKNDPQTRAPRRKDSYAVIFRRDYAPLTLELTKPAFRILSALAAGKTLGEAIRTTRTANESLYRWFQIWVSEGLFREVTVSD